MIRIRNLLPDRPDRTRGALSRRSDSRRLLWTLAPCLAVVVVAALIGAVAGGSEWVGLALAALVLGLGIYVADPILLAVIVLPGSLLLQRVGGSGTNLSVADLLVFLAGVVCLFHVRWQEAGYLRQFLKGIVWYQAVLILVVMAHPNRYDVVEWFHRFSYLAASVLVGWVVASNGRTRQTLRLFLWCSALLAVLAMEHAVTGHFQPAQWGSYQKNAIGAVMWVAVAVAQINPPWAQLRRAETRVLEVFCIGGLLASQSRQAAISLIVALVAVTVLNPDVRRRSKLVLLGLAPLAVAVYYSFSVAARNNPQFNSVSIRFGQIGDALHVWHLSPILGLGMRFYYLPQYITVTAPPNVIIDNLASTGIVGSIAFFYLVYMTMRTMGRLPYVFGTLGLAILLGHYVDGLFDIFFIGASMIPPFLIAGISLGMADADRREPVGAPMLATNDTAGARRQPLVDSGRRRSDKTSGPSEMLR
ncbi:MAG TPA: O-antigen ligase family protein [Acidimicrobiales bacterium]|nr:O-antigen ligase family protein [Acidimicrobiales bacterium]